MHLLLFALISFFSCTIFGGHGFIAGTLVHTPDGPIPIERIKIGCSVISYTANGARTVGVVTALHNDYTDGYVAIFTGGEWIGCAGDHRFFLPLGNKWRKAKRLRKHHQLLLDGRQIDFVYHRMWINQSVQTYDLTVETSHNYCVGNNAINVHNFVAVGLLSRLAGLAYGVAEGILCGLAVYVAQQQVEQRRAQQLIPLASTATSCASAAPAEPVVIDQRLAAYAADYFHLSLRPQEKAYIPGSTGAVLSYPATYRQPSQASVWQLYAAQPGTMAQQPVIIHQELDLVPNNNLIALQNAAIDISAGLLVNCVAQQKNKVQQNRVVREYLQKLVDLFQPMPFVTFAYTLLGWPLPNEILSYFPCTIQDNEANERAFMRLLYAGFISFDSPFPNRQAIEEAWRMYGPSKTAGQHPTISHPREQARYELVVRSPHYQALLRQMADEQKAQELILAKKRAETEQKKKVESFSGGSSGGGNKNDDEEERKRKLERLVKDKSEKDGKVKARDYKPGQIFGRHKLWENNPKHMKLPNGIASPKPPDGKEQEFLDAAMLFATGASRGKDLKIGDAFKGYLITIKNNLIYIFQYHTSKIVNEEVCDLYHGYGLTLKEAPNEVIAWLSKNGFLKGNKLIDSL